MPTRIIVLRHEKEWANRQIVDEFKTVFTEIDVCVTPRLLLEETPDLIVLPFLHDFSLERPGGAALYHELGATGQIWVMLYGLAHRAIDVMPASDVLPYFRRCRFVGFTNLCLHHLRLLRPVRRLYRLWWRS